MKIDKNNAEQAWISLILRIAMILLFGLAAFGKFSMGLDKFSSMTMEMFKDTFLPTWLLSPYVHILPFAEALVALWLLVGINLRVAWILTALLLISLTFGLMIKQNPMVSGMYTYLLIACLGIYTSKFDGCGIGCCCKK